MSLVTRMFLVTKLFIKYTSENGTLNNKTFNKIYAQHFYRQPGPRATNPDVKRNAIFNV